MSLSSAWTKLNRVLATSHSRGHALGEGGLSTVTGTIRRVLARLGQVGDKVEEGSPLDGQQL